MEAARHRDETAPASDEPVDIRIPETPAQPMPSHVQEIVVASTFGEVLYERGSTASRERAAVLKMLYNVTQRLGSPAGLGTLERVECPDADDCITVRLQDHGSIFARGKKVE